VPTAFFVAFAFAFCLSPSVLAFCLLLLLFAFLPTAYCLLSTVYFLLFPAFLP
jgi:hypothetical protein